MRPDKSKTTILALIALVLVCGGSFLAMKTLNGKIEAPLPPVTTTVPSTTTQPATEQPLPSATLPTAAPVLPTAPLKNDETTEKKPTSPIFNPFTTFAAGSVTNPTMPTVKETEKKTEPALPETTVVKTEKPTQAETEAQEVIERAAVFSDGFLSYKYDKDGDFYFTADDPWQRNFGFNELYDVGASFIAFYYDTMRCKFRYDDKDWLIQFWKGQYGFVFLGWEIGVYNKPVSRTSEHYDCAEDKDMLKMSLTGFRKGEEQFSREYGKFWWCTGFVRQA